MSQIQEVSVAESLTLLPTITDRSISPVVDVLAGSMGGMAGTVVGQPLDLVKVRLQSNFVNASILSTIRHTWIYEGMRGFWRGVVPPIMAEALINTVYFGTYAGMQRVLQPNPDIPWTTTQAAIAGAVSGITGTFVVGPTELVKIRVQVGKQLETSESELKRTLRAAKGVYREEGLLGFTRGFKVTLFREVPCIAFYFGLYDYCKKSFRSRDGTLSAVGQIMAGGLAGSGSWAITYPFDVLKTRIQADSVPISISGCARHLWATQGIRGFYAGVMPCAIRAFPVNAVIFAIYEWVLRLARG
jgi:solute carrier family 25 carnitine/acylcarnitine transporter 20/29